MGIGYRTYPPAAFDRVMVFVDGTNLFYRLEAEKVALCEDLSKIVGDRLGIRQLVRIYLYTIQEHLDKSKRLHGSHMTNKIRLVLGKGIPTKDGNIKEKGVDALLVADLVYHAAMKNYDYALLVSADTDFTKAVQRIEDFGCKTGILGIGFDPPDELKSVCDDVTVLTVQQLLDAKLAVKLS